MGENEGRGVLTSAVGLFILDVVCLSPCANQLIPSGFDATMAGPTEEQAHCPPQVQGCGAEKRCGMLN